MTYTSLFLIQTCEAEISSDVSSCQKLAAFHHLMRILQVCIDILKSKHAGLLYCALCTVNYVVDACIVHEAHHLWLLEHNEVNHKPGGATTTTTTTTTKASNQENKCLYDIQQRSSYKGVSGSGCRKDSSDVSQSQPAFSRDMKSSLKSDRGSHFGKKQTKSGKIHFMSHQESNWSLRSILTHFDNLNHGGTSQDTSFAEGEPEMENCSGSHSGHELPQLSVQSPLDVLTASDPVLIVGILQDAINKYKAGIGRHKCTPSVRQMSCSNHCVQILSARILTLMCHSQVIQQKVVKNGHIKVLVEALDPNHDPVSCYCIIDQFPE